LLQEQRKIDKMSKRIQELDCNRFPNDAGNSIIDI
jgi:hypothetical protein